MICYKIWDGGKLEEAFMSLLRILTLSHSFFLFLRIMRWEQILLFNFKLQFFRSGDIDNIYKHMPNKKMRLLMCTISYKISLYTLIKVYLKLFWMWRLLLEKILNFNMTILWKEFTSLNISDKETFSLEWYSWQLEE